MPEHHAHHDAPDLSKRYEQSDLSFPAIKKGVLFYFIFTAAIGLVVYGGLMVLHETTPEKVRDQIPPQPYPLLQNGVTAQTDIWNLRAREDYLLHNYTYADPNHQYAREPIDKAMEQTAQAGPESIVSLPNGYEATPQPAANASTSQPAANPSTPNYSKEVNPKP